jgi:hypothetical protein
MKFSLFAFALFSTAVFAIGAEGLSGSFDTKNISQNKFVVTVDGLDKSRAPASIAEQKKIPQYTELTGTFE